MKNKTEQEKLVRVRALKISLPCPSCKGNKSKISKIGCPICKGAGTLLFSAKQRSSEEEMKKKVDTAKKLRKKGCTLLQIASMMGYRSQAGVTNLLSRPTKGKKITYYLFYWGINIKNKSIHSNKVRFESLESVKSHSKKHKSNSAFLGKQYWSKYETITKTFTL